jgi:hypothetical protein
MTRTERTYLLVFGGYNLAQFFIAPVYPLFLLTLRARPLPDQRRPRDVSGHGVRARDPDGRVRRSLRPAAARSW